MVWSYLWLDRTPWFSMIPHPGYTERVLPMTCRWDSLSLVSVFRYFDRVMVWLPLLAPLFLAGLTRVQSLNYGYGSQPRAQRSDDPTEEWLQQWQQVHDHHLCPPCKSFLNHQKFIMRYFSSHLWTGCRCGASSSSTEALC